MGVPVMVQASDHGLLIQDADAALEYLVHETAEAMSPEDERRLLRKIDWRIVPLMWCVYNLQFLDKTLINYAAVMGIYEDASINTTQFSFLALIFYVSYLAFELPTGYLMQRLPTAKYLGVNVIAWGICVAATSACKSFGALVALRVLLGCFESAVAPALILLTTMWYKRQEQPPRIGFWFVGIGTAMIIGALSSYGFQHYISKLFSSWQIMFLVFGLITIVVGVCVIIFLPDNPMTAKFLTPTEKVWAIERVRENQTGIENKHFKPSQAVECLLDPHTWLLCLITITANVPGGAIGSFQATIIKGFGYNPKQTALLSMPSGAVSVVGTLFATYAAGHFNQRALCICVLLGLGASGGALMAFLPTEARAGKLIGNYLTNCIGSVVPLLYSWAAANYAGHSKKVMMNAVLLMSFCLGNIIGPETFKARDAPDFIPAKVAILATCATAGCLTLILRFLLVRENASRDRRAAAGEVVGKAGMKEMAPEEERKQNWEFLDMTDRENGDFRYRL